VLDEMTDAQQADFSPTYGRPVPERPPWPEKLDSRIVKANHGNGIAGFLQSNPMAPQIPNMASTRGMQEGAAGAEELLADADSADAEAPFAEPAQRDPEEA
jgi:hypothetical protein